MAQAVKDSFLDLERHRQLLEENVEKLRKSLQHWQLWEAEYGGLKEEILALEGTPTRQQLAAISEEYEGILVTKKEVADILGLEASKTTAQVVNILDRRIDYVQQNVRSIQKQFGTAENKLAASAIISNPEVRNEDGLPFTEIIEELDEEGNVISSRLSTPGNAKTQLLEVLEKAGIREIPHSNSEQASAAASIHNVTSSRQQETPSQVTTKDVTTSQPKGGSPTPSAVKAAKRGVKFTKETKSGPEEQKSQTAKRIEDIMKLAKQQEDVPSEPPVIPADESPEDAALRREMLQYGLSEVGAVVAELDLENGSDWSDGEYDDDSSTDDEDEFGRSTKRVVDDDIRREMIALEERLGVRMMENIGSKASDYDIVQEGIGRVTISGKEHSPQESVAVALKSSLASSADTQISAGEASPSATQSSKKSVKFAEELHIAPSSQPSAPSSTVRGVAPVSDIIERTTPHQADEPAHLKRSSRFKASRATANMSAPTSSQTSTQTPNIINGPLATPQSGPSLKLFPAASQTPKPFSTPLIFSPSTTDNPRAVPTGPENQILASSIVERETPSYSAGASNVTVREPDELDPQLLNQEVAVEYHKMRNRMIQRQGGFAKEEESEVVPFTEEEGGPKKMSRFKAARLAKS